MRRHLIASLFCVLSLGSAQAEPLLKVINFTADWCQSCRLLNPRLNEAIKAYPAGEISRIDLDLTDLQSDLPPRDLARLHEQIWQTANRHKASFLVEWFRDTTGIAIVIAADTGEPLSCIDSAVSEEAIRKRLMLAKIVAEKGSPGTRKPLGTSCPAGLSS